MPRLLCSVGLLLLLILVFSSQLFFAGMSLRGRGRFPRRRCTGSRARSSCHLSCGCAASASGRTRMGALRRWSVGRRHRRRGAAAGSRDLHRTRAGMAESLLPGVRSAPGLVGVLLRTGDSIGGVNLTVYASFVLAWHAATYYREARDRQLKALELELLLHQAQLQGIAQPAQSAFSVQCAAFDRRAGARKPEARGKTDRPAGRVAAPGSRSRRLQEVTLADELEFIRGYVDIEQMRLGERLRVIWDVPPELLPASGAEPDPAAAGRERDSARHRSHGEARETHLGRAVARTHFCAWRCATPALEWRANRRGPAKGNRPREHPGAPATPVRRCQKLELVVDDGRGDRADTLLAP